MKLVKFIAGLAICAALALFIFIQVIGSRGDSATLNAIRAIRHGMTASEVREIMRRNPQIVPAHTLPDWLHAAVPEKADGEYWYYYMGYPPRNLIIYIDGNGKVVFMTWQPT